jgi:hypothetical protein
MTPRTTRLLNPAMRFVRLKTVWYNATLHRANLVNRLRNGAPDNHRQLVDRIQISDARQYSLYEAMIDAKDELKALNIYPL